MNERNARTVLKVVAIALTVMFLYQVYGIVNTDTAQVANWIQESRP